VLGSLSRQPQFTKPPESSIPLPAFTSPRGMAEFDVRERTLFCNKMLCFCTRKQANRVDFNRGFS
jgi:hypothetical protein